MRPGFPPHSCGGLIEAKGTVARLADGTPVFPRIRAGASLKHGRAARGVHRERQVFPRIRAGASLKRDGAKLIPAQYAWFSPAFVRGPH